MCRGEQGEKSLFPSYPTLSYLEGGRERERERERLAQKGEGRLGRGLVDTIIEEKVEGCYTEVLLHKSKIGMN